MKKTIKNFALAALVASTTLAVSCSKEQDLSGYMTREEFEQWQSENQSTQLVTVKTFSITFPAIQDDFSSSTTYQGLRGSIGSNDVLLVYANLNGQLLPLPMTTGGTSYYYLNNNGVLNFTKSLTLKGSADSETLNLKALIIPAVLYHSKSKSVEADFSTFEGAMKILGK